MDILRVWCYLTQNFILICTVRENACILKFSITAVYINMLVAMLQMMMGHMLI
jgi:hypothetical protein